MKMETWLAVGDVTGVAEEPESGDVGCAARADGDGASTGRRVELRHGVDQPLRLFRSEVAALGRGRENGGAERLGEHEAVADLGVRVAQHLLGIHAPGHRQPELQLVVDDRVAADDERAGFVDLVLPAAEDVGEHVEREPIRGKADDVERGERLAAHRVHVRERVRRGDLAERVRIVDDGREEVDRLHEREIFRQLKHAGVVEGLAPDEQPRVRFDRDAGEGLREIETSELRGASRAPRERRESGGVLR